MSLVQLAVMHTSKETYCGRVTVGLNQWFLKWYKFINNQHSDRMDDYFTHIRGSCVNLGVLDVRKFGLTEKLAIMNHGNPTAVIMQDRQET